MIFGYDSLVSDFKRLVDEGRLSHAYLFFGEPQTGKFLFARSLANYIETKNFDEPTASLLETLIIDFESESEEESKESVGIEKVREVERFLYQTPISSRYRIAVIRDAEWLTDAAQNALLKILEEPPKDGVIIAIAKDSSVFLPTVASRMQGIYFKTLSSESILDFLGKCGRISTEKGKQIDRESFGRVGRAASFLKENVDRKKVENTLEKLFNKRNPGKTDIESNIDELLKIFDKSPRLIPVFFEIIIKKIRSKAINRPSAVGDINREITLMETLAVNKRIHLKNILWTTIFILSG